METRHQLRAWMRYDSLNRAVAGSLIYSKDRPKIGNWREVATRQSGSVTTTTSTSTTNNVPLNAITTKDGSEYVKTINEEYITA